jgi:hypothetical protein
MECGMRKWEVGVKGLRIGRAISNEHRAKYIVASVGQDMDFIQYSTLPLFHYSNCERSELTFSVFKEPSTALDVLFSRAE